MLEEIQQWFKEAVALHGDDWPSIEQYVKGKMAHFTPAQQARLRDEFKAIQPVESTWRH
jgi:predicted NAD-dependent protein-ADP-ribosyltransferase YbiA (DUF1768 family)